MSEGLLYQSMRTVTAGYEQESASEEAKDVSPGKFESDASSTSSMTVIKAQIEEKVDSSVTVASSFQSPSLEADFAMSSAALTEVL